MNGRPGRHSTLNPGTLVPRSVTSDIRLIVPSIICTLCVPPVIPSRVATSMIFCFPSTTIPQFWGLNPQSSGYTSTIHVLSFTCFPSLPYQPNPPSKLFRFGRRGVSFLFFLSRFVGSRAWMERKVEKEFESGKLLRMNGDVGMCGAQ